MMYGKHALLLLIINSGGFTGASKKSGPPQVPSLGCVLFFMEILKHQKQVYNTKRSMDPLRKNSEKPSLIIIIYKINTKLCLNV